MTIRIQYTDKSTGYQLIPILFINLQKNLKEVFALFCTFPKYYSIFWKKDIGWKDFKWERDIICITLPI